MDGNSCSQNFPGPPPDREAKWSRKWEKKFWTRDGICDGDMGDGIVVVAVGEFRERRRDDPGLECARSSVCAVTSTIIGPSIGPGHCLPARRHWVQFGSVSSQRIRRL